MKLNKGAIVHAAVHCDKCGRDYEIKLPDTHKEYQRIVTSFIGVKCHTVAIALGQNSNCDGILLNYVEAKQACFMAYLVSFPLYRFLEWLTEIKAKLRGKRVEEITVQVHHKYNREVQKKE